jgi:hypothetical protein
MGMPIVVLRSGITQMVYRLGVQPGLVLFGRAISGPSSSTADWSGLS